MKLLSKIMTFWCTYWLFNLTNTNRGIIWIYYKDWAITLSFQVQIKQIGYPFKAKRQRISLGSRAILDIHILGMISGEEGGMREGDSPFQLVFIFLSSLILSSSFLFFSFHFRSLVLGSICNLHYYGGIGLQASSRRLQRHYGYNLESLCLIFNHVCFLDSLPSLICKLALNGIDIWVYEW